MTYNEKDLPKDKKIFWKNNQELLNSTYWKNLKHDHDPITGLDIDPVSGNFIYPDTTDDFDLPPEVFIPGFHD